MGDPKFWRPRGFDFSSLFNFLKFGKGEEGGFQSPGRNLKNLYKRLGVGGGILLAVAGIFFLALFFFVVRPSYALIAQSNKLKGELDEFKSSFRDQDLDRVKGSLERLNTDILEFRQVRDGNFPWAKSFPLTKSYYYDSEHFINSGVYLVDALSEFVVVVEPFSDAAGFKSRTEVEVKDPNAASGFADAFASWVKVMPEVADKMDGVIEKFDRVGTELSYVDAKKYPESFRGIAVRSNIEAAQQYLSKAKEFGPDIKAALTAIPPALGVGGVEKRYAIIMQNDAELRPTGGFWTNFATFKVKDAMLTSDFSSKDMYSIDEIIQTTDTPWTSPWPAPYPPYKTFLLVEHTFARDANFSPDFVTAVEKWMWYYNKVALLAPAEAKPIDGVFAIDTNVIKRLLEITGPVVVNGTSYSSDNVVLELEKIASLGLKEQQGRKRVLGDLMEAMLINMYKSEKNLWPKFVEAAVSLAMEKHIQGYIFDDPKAQELLEKYNFSGRIRNFDGGDYSFVVSTNLAGDKTNLFVSKKVDHRIFQESGKWVHEVVVNFTYGDAPPGYEPLIKVYRDWVRVYAPAGSNLISVEGSDAKTDADTGEEMGKVYFAGHVTVNPSTTASIKFKYEIPQSIMSGKEYKVYLQKQAGTRSETHTVTVNGKSQSIELATDKEVTLKLN